MSPTQEAAMKMALEALQNCANGEDDVLLTRDALAALRAALAEPAHPAIPLENSREAADAIEATLAEYEHPTNPVNAARAGWRAARLYTAPPQRSATV